MRQFPVGYLGNPIARRGLRSVPQPEWERGREGRRRAPHINRGISFFVVAIEVVITLLLALRAHFERNRRSADGEVRRLAK